MKFNNILSLKVDTGYECTTIGGYLRDLLVTLMREGESFSGKRPFGNSSWEYDLYKPLIEAKLIAGELDEDGDILDVDVTSADEMIIECIEWLFASITPGGESW